MLGWFLGKKQAQENPFWRMTHTWRSTSLLGGMKLGLRGSLIILVDIVCGFPLPVLGHNENIAWGSENVMTDDMDFILKHSTKTLQNIFNGKWEDLTIKKEKIIQIWKRKRSCY